MDSEKFEREILKLAFETDVRITVATVAYYFGIPSRDARVKLDELIDAGLLELDSDRDGNLYYKLHQEAGSAVAGHIESLTAPTAKPPIDLLEESDTPSRRPSISETLAYSPSPAASSEPAASPHPGSSDDRCTAPPPTHDLFVDSPQDRAIRNITAPPTNHSHSQNDHQYSCEEPSYPHSAPQYAPYDAGYAAQERPQYTNNPYYNAPYSDVACSNAPGKQTYTGGSPQSNHQQSNRQDPRYGYPWQQTLGGNSANYGDPYYRNRSSQHESPYYSMGYTEGSPYQPPCPNYRVSPFIIADNAACDAYNPPYNSSRAYPTHSNYRNPSEEYYLEQQREALLPAVTQDQNPEEIDLNRKHHPAIAVLLSLCLPGAGQFYNGQIEKGVFMMLMTFLSWMALFGWAFQLWSIFDALIVASRIRSTQDAHRAQLEQQESQQRRAITSVRRYQSPTRRR